MAKRNEENTKELEELIESITLNVFNTGTKHLNYQIIKSLPTNVNSIMKETKLTKVPVNKHINELEKYGLIRREKGTGNVYPTDLTHLFESLIEEIEKNVKANISKMLPSLIN